MCWLLERFGGYTYSTLLAEDAGFLRMVTLDRYSSRHDEVTDE